MGLLKRLELLAVTEVWVVSEGRTGLERRTGWEVTAGPRGRAAEPKGRAAELRGKAAGRWRN
jgi:hypothetical protein